MEENKCGECKHFIFDPEFDYECGCCSKMLSTRDYFDKPCEEFSLKQ